MAKIEYFYSAHSLFAYLGSAKLNEIARAGGRRIDHRPYDLDTAMVASGAVPFTERSKPRYAYFFIREKDRWAEERGVPIMAAIPTDHRKDMTLPNCMLIAGVQAGLNIDRLAHVLLEAHWRDDADIADPATLASLAETADVKPGPLLEAAKTPAVLTAYEANTEEAVRRSVFGAPTYFVDGDMFYGQDRLEMVERALARPYAGTWPPASAT